MTMTVALCVGPLAVLGGYALGELLLFIQTRGRGWGR